MFCCSLHQKRNHRYVALVAVIWLSRNSLILAVSTRTDEFDWWNQTISQHILMNGESIFLDMDPVSIDHWQPTNFAISQEAQYVELEETKSEEDVMGSHHAETASQTATETLEQDSLSKTPKQLEPYISVPADTQSIFEDVRAGKEGGSPTERKQTDERAANEDTEIKPHYEPLSNESIPLSVASSFATSDEEVSVQNFIPNFSKNEVESTSDNINVAALESVSDPTEDLLVNQGSKEETTFDDSELSVENTSEGSATVNIFPNQHPDLEGNTEQHKDDLKPPGFLPEIWLEKEKSVSLHADSDASVGSPEVAAEASPVSQSTGEKVYPFLAGRKNHMKQDTQGQDGAANEAKLTRSDEELALDFDNSDVESNSLSTEVPNHTPPSEDDSSPPMDEQKESSASRTDSVESGSFASFFQEQMNSNDGNDFLRRYSERQVVISHSSLESEETMRQTNHPESFSQETGMDTSLARDREEGGDRSNGEDAQHGERHASVWGIQSKKSTVGGDRLSDSQQPPSNETAKLPLAEVNERPTSSPIVVSNGFDDSGSQLDVETTISDAVVDTETTGEEHSTEDTGTTNVIENDDQEASSTPASKSVNDAFVDGLDDIDKFMEAVDPPDELDVGAAGSSIQEVLLGQGAQILMKRIAIGIRHVRKYVRGLGGKAAEAFENYTGRLKDEDGKFAVVVLSQERIGKAVKRVQKICRRGLRRFQDLVSEHVFLEDAEDDVFNEEAMKLADLRSLVEKRSRLQPAATGSRSRAPTFDMNRASQAKEESDLHELVKQRFGQKL